MKSSRFALLVVAVAIVLSAVPALAGMPREVAVSKVEKADARIAAAIEHAQLLAEKHSKLEGTVTGWLIRVTENIAMSTDRSLENSGYRVQRTWVEVRIGDEVVRVDPMEVAGY